jgi:ferredoxin-NADP reductase
MKKRGYENGRIDYTFLKEKIDNFKQHFYVCGPPQFVTAISEALTQLGAKTDAVVFEK